MKKNVLTIMCVVSAIVIGSCNNEQKREASGDDAEIKNDKVSQESETAIDNAGKAKRPKGTINLKIDGELFSANENTVQCMFIDMGTKEYAQGTISGNVNGGISISAVMMTKPEVGIVKSKGAVATHGMMVTKDGVEYGSKPDLPFSIEITKVTPDGSNYYIGGTFSGTLESKDGKTIKITEGVFKSAYL
jgi:hypothetical protein